APSPSVFLSAVAQRTRRLRFGPLVWAMPLHHPLRLIEEICMLDQLSRGRLELGFGRGSVPVEIEYYGADPEEAQAIYAEAVEGGGVGVLGAGLGRRVLAGGDRRLFFGAGRRGRDPGKTPPPPIWYGVHRPESGGRAARPNLKVVSLDPRGEPRLSIERYRTI